TQPQARAVLERPQRERVGPYAQRAAGPRRAQTPRQREAAVGRQPVTRQHARLERRDLAAGLPDLRAEDRPGGADLEAEGAGAVALEIVDPEEPAARLDPREVPDQHVVVA